MLPRFHLSDISTVGHHLGTLVVLTGLLMCIPLAVALLFGEFASAVDFVFGAGVCLALGSALRLLKASRIDRRGSLLLTGFSWLVVGLVAAIPLFVSGAYGSYLDALFDSVSSITTTGTSLATNLDALSYSQVTWHAVLTLAGGQAVIFIAVYMGFFGEGSFATVARSRGYSDLIASDFTSSSRYIWIVTGALTGIGTIAACAIGLYLGLSPADAIVDAFCLASNAANTGGFVPHASNLIYYHSVWLDALVVMLTMLGAVSLGIYSLALRGRYGRILRNSEFRAFAIWTSVFVAFIAVGVSQDAVYTTMGGLVDRGMFTALFSITTSGMETIYPDQLATCLSDGVLILMILAVCLGACSCTTSGGIKILRVTMVLRWFGYTIFRAILPDSARMGIRYNNFGPRRMSAADAQQAMTIMILYLAAAALGAMAFIAHGNDALGSVLESVSFVSNSGMSSGITQPGMAADLKLVAIAQMWAGRLEFIALIAAIAGIFISLRPLPDRDRSRAKRKMRSSKHRRETPWHRLEHERKRKREGSEQGAAHVPAIALTLLLTAALALSPLAGTAFGAGGEETPGPEVSASQIESLKSEAVESYREMKVSDLVTASYRLDGRRVQVTGTVYGTSLAADEKHVWVNVKSGRYMIGVYVTRTQAAQIENYGSYRNSGDTVTVRGVYHQVCNKHQGELDLHATKLTVDSPGHMVSHEPNRQFLLIGLLHAAVGVGLGVLKRVLYGPSRRKRRLLFGLS